MIHFTTATDSKNGANGIYHATLPDSGPDACPASWTLVSRPDNGWPAGMGSGTPSTSGGNPAGRIDLAIAPSDPAWMYAEVMSEAPDVGGGNFLGVWQTEDGGVTWQRRLGAENLYAPCVDPVGTLSQDGQHDYNQALVVDPNDPLKIFFGGLHPWLSLDVGHAKFLNCPKADNTQTHLDQHVFAFAPSAPGDSSRLLLGNDGGIYLSTNADAISPVFNSINTGLNNILFFSGDITNDFATTATPGGVGGSQDNGAAVTTSATLATWIEQRRGDGSTARIDQIQSRQWYLSYFSQRGTRIERSDNGADGPFNLIDTSGGNPPWEGDGAQEVMPYDLTMANCPSTGCTHLLVGANHLWETTNSTDSSPIWQVKTPPTGWGHGAPYAVSYNRHDETIAILGYAGAVGVVSNLGTGIDNATWVDAVGGVALPNRVVTDVTLDTTSDPGHPLLGYAAIGGYNGLTPGHTGHVFQLTCTAGCASVTWANKTGDLPDVPINSIAVNPNYPQQVFAGGEWALYYTDDITVAAPQWHRFTAGLPNVAILHMSVDRDATTLALWTYGHGAYAWPLPMGPLHSGFQTGDVFVAQPYGVVEQYRNGARVATLRAYPNNPAARKAMRAHAKCRKPR